MRSSACFTHRQKMNHSHPGLTGLGEETDTIALQRLLFPVSPEPPKEHWSLETFNTTTMFTQTRWFQAEQRGSTDCSQTCQILDYYRQGVVMGGISILMRYYNHRAQHTHSRTWSQTPSRGQHSTTNTGVSQHTSGPAPLVPATAPVCSLLSSNLIPCHFEEDSIHQYTLSYSGPASDN
ncbi:uncharacterized protein LOC135111539 [Scylla paramamosain]|uniref:uncharacterized protein LOC135111539 n=1 Tax=Scylla paramamosain TaxID=85552 RepID=UPI003082D055